MVITTGGNSGERDSSHRRRVLLLGAALALMASGVSAAAASTPGGGGARATSPVGGTSTLDASAGRQGTSPGGAQNAASPLPTAQLPPSTTVTLPTGDQVTLDVDGNGEQTATPKPAGGAAASGTFAQFTWDGDLYVVPDVAVPYLNTALDPRLFDVSYLAKANLGTAKHPALPATIVYGGGTAPALPAVDVTHRAGATATATIDTTKAAAFKRLLDTQWRQVRSGHATAPLGHLPGVSRIGLPQRAGVPALPGTSAPRATPAAPGQNGRAPRFHTLTLNFTDEDGKPGTFFGFPQNIDDLTLANSTGVGTTLLAGVGTERISVPEGTYSLHFSVFTPHASDPGFDTALVIRPEITVRSDQTISMDARTAVPYQATLDKPADTPARIDAISFARTDVNNSGTLVMANGNLGPNTFRLWSVSPNPVPTIATSRLLATPTPRVTRGGFGFDATTLLAKTFGGIQGPDPGYVLDFPSDGAIPSTLTHTVPTADLTTVHTRIHDSTRSENDCVDDRPTDIQVVVTHVFGGRLWGPLTFGYGVPTGDRTDYWYTGDPELDLWQPAFSPKVSCFLGRRLDFPRQLRHGGEVTEEWNKAPFVPAPLAPYLFLQDPRDWVHTQVDDITHSVCPACRQDDNAVLYLVHPGDSVTTHDTNGYADPDNTSKVDFYRDGTLVLSSDAEFVDWLLPVDLNLPLVPQTATYQLDWSWSSPVDPAGSTDTHWTFRSGGNDRTSALPKSEQCAPDASRGCSFLPLLFVTYDLSLDDGNQAPAGGPFDIDFTVAAQQNAPAPSGVSATVSASFDDGKTWTDAKDATALGGGKFTTTIDHPGAGDTNGFVSLRVTAHDSAGNAVDQTTIRAYGLTS